MSQTQLKSPRCQGKMEMGVVIDAAHYGTPTRQNWVEGIPRWSRWVGLKIRGLVTYPVISYRCEKCGYVESYANLEVGT